MEGRRCDARAAQCGAQYALRLRTPAFGEEVARRLGHERQPEQRQRHEQSQEHLHLAPGEPERTQPGDEA